MFERHFPASEILHADGVADVSAIVAANAAERRPVYTVGGGTTLGLGAAVNEPGVVLSLAKLDGLVDYPSRDLTITVEAGMTIAQLAEHLGAENQRLPLDIPRSDTATVGGVVAANLSGPRRYRYGSVRDYLLGFTAVDGAGEAFSGGGRVVKNAAGYDLTRLMIGSLGTLGLLTQVTLMVRPRPETSAFCAAALPTLGKADSLLEALATSGVEPAALELLAGEGCPESLTSDAHASLWIGFEGGEPEVHWMLDKIAELCRDLDLKSESHVDPDKVEKIWDELTQHGSLVPADTSSEILAVEATVLPGKITELASQLREQVPDASLHARVGNGVLSIRNPCPADQAAQRACQVRETAVALGGRAVVTSWPTESRLDQQTVWGHRGSGLTVMERIKQQFDPAGILNPGRFIFDSTLANTPT